MTSSLPHRLHPAASARFTPESTRGAEPWHTCLLGYSLTGTAYGVGAASGVGIVAAVGVVTSFLNGKSSSE
jgi:hypothetical protein